MGIKRRTVLPLLLVDVDAVVLVVVAYLLSEKPIAMYAEAVANEARRNCSFEYAPAS